MTRGEVTGRKICAMEGDCEDARDAFSVQEFCKRHGFSIQLYYKLKDEMPESFRIGARVLISREAAARWRAEREAAGGAR